MKRKETECGFQNAVLFACFLSSYSVLFSPATQKERKKKKETGFSTGGHPLSYIELVLFFFFSRVFPF